MLNRNCIKCKTCNNIIIRRVGFGVAKKQKFVFQCPYCGVILRGILNLDYDTLGFSYSSEDFEPTQELPEDEIDKYEQVTIYTEIPVHISAQGQPMKRGGSAFIDLWRFMGDNFIDFNQKKDLIYKFRLDFYPTIRRMGTHFATGDWLHLASVMKIMKNEKSFEKIGCKLTSSHPSLEFGDLIQRIYIPIIPIDIGIKYNDEILIHMSRCQNENKEKFKDLLVNLFDEGFRDFQRKLTETTLSAFNKFDAMIPGLCYEGLIEEAKNHLDEFQIFRDDFDELKILYIELFELSSKALAYIGTILNLSIRENADSWSNGNERSLNNVLRLRACDREFIFDELIEVKQLYEKIDRQTRNSIGHYNVHYDFQSGMLVDNRRGIKNFMEFLYEYLNAVRATFFLIGFTAVINERYDYFITYKKDS